MRSEAIFVILTTAFLTASVAAFAQDELIPIAAWSFNRCSEDLSEGHILDGAGQRLDLLQGKPNHLTSNGTSCASLVGREGRFGDAGWFSGSAAAESRVAVPLGEEFSVSAWAYPEQPQGNFIVAGGAGSYGLSYNETLNGGQGGFRFVYGSASIDSGAAPPGDWHQVTAAVGPDSTCPGEMRLRIYVDGVPDAGPAACAPPMSVSESVLVGAGFRGRIDEVTLYRTSLNQAQVSDLYGSPKAVYLGADTSAHPEDGDYPTDAAGSRNPLGYDFYLGRLADGLAPCSIGTFSGHDIVTGDPVTDSCSAFQMFAAAVARPQRTYGYVLLRGPNQRPTTLPDGRAYGAEQANVLAAQRDRYRHVVFGKTLFADIEDLANSGWDTACESGDAGACASNQEVLEGFLARAVPSGFTTGVYTTVELWNRTFGSTYVPPVNFVAWITGWNTSAGGSGLPAGGKNVDVDSLREFEQNAFDGMQGVLWQYTITLPADFDATRQDPTVRFVPRTGGAVDTMLVIDSSGSMSTTDAKRKRVAAGKTYVAASVDDDFVGVVDFDSAATLLADLLRVGDNRTELNGFIDQIDASGGTNIGAGLGLACNILEASSSTGNTVRAAILLTDGEGTFSAEDECFRQKGWPIYTFGFGDLSMGAQDLLKGIADRTNGKFALITPTTSLCAFQRVRSEISGEPAAPCTTAHVAPGGTVPFEITIPVGQARATFSTSWPGSDVILSFVTPSGRVIDRATSAPDVFHLAGDTFEVYAIENPEPGIWEVALFGADVPAGGEDVTFVWTTVPSEGGTMDIASLLAEVQEACGRGGISPRGICRSLEAKLMAAQRALDRGRLHTAKHQLRAFLAELDAQRGKHVPEDVYLRLKSGAEALLVTLSQEHGRERDPRKHRPGHGESRGARGSRMDAGSHR